MNEENRNIYSRIKVVLLLVVLGILLVFALQNSENVTLAFLFWELNLPRVFIFFIFFCAGVLCGIFINTLMKLKKSP